MDVDVLADAVLDGAAEPNAHDRAVLAGSDLYIYSRASDAEFRVCQHYPRAQFHLQVCAFLYLSCKHVFMYQHFIAAAF